MQSPLWEVKKGRGCVSVDIYLIHTPIYTYTYYMRVHALFKVVHGLKFMFGLSRKMKKDHSSAVVLSMRKGVLVYTSDRSCVPIIAVGDECR